MRLTLRTLLAYRDRVLSPSDHEDLHGRIQQSEFASNLLRRIDSIAHRQGVGSPPVVGKGVGSDPNSIAEYLDDALQAAQVPEFERVCLMSDAQLAELVHCHSMLATALTTKLAVPPGLQETAKRFSDPSFAAAFRKSIGGSGQAGTTTEALPGGQLRGDAGHPLAGPHFAVQPKEGEGEGVAVQVQVPMVVSAGTSIKPQGLDLESTSLPHEVPTYLRSHGSGKWMMPVAIGGLLAILSVLIWQTLGPWENIREMMVADRVSSQPNTSSPESSEANALPTLNNSGESTDANPAVTSAPPTASPATSPTASESGDSNPVSPPSTVDASSVESAVPDAAATTPPTAGTSGDVAGSSSVASPLTSDLSSASSLASWTPSNPNERLATVLVKDSNGHLSVQAPEQAIGVGASIYTTSLVGTSFALPGGMRFTALGPTSASLVDVQADATPALEMRFGRGILKNESDQVLRANVRSLNRPFEISLEASGRVSIETEYRLAQLGSLAEAGTMKPVCILLAIGTPSTITFQDDKEKIQLNVGEGLALLPDNKLQRFVLRRIPVWLKNTSVRPIDRLAEEDLSAELSAAGDAADIVSELAKLLAHPRPEVAAAAARLMLVLGVANPATKVLARPDMAAHWSSVIDTMQQSAASGQIRAEEVAGSIAPLIPNASPELIQQLALGLSSEEVAGGGVSTLVASLESRNLAERVLAIQQLQRLTGDESMYLAHRPSKEAVQYWRRKNTTGQMEMLKPIDLVREKLAP